jgi:hypothetical protein
MDEEDLGYFSRFQPFETEAAVQRQTQMARCAALGRALWGKTADDLRRQLQQKFPDVPSGFTVADFRELLDVSQRVESLAMLERRNAWLTWLTTLSGSTGTISVGTQRFTAWQARSEIVRRAIDCLEQR